MGLSSETNNLNPTTQQWQLFISARKLNNLPQWILQKQNMWDKSDSSIREVGNWPRHNSLHTHPRPHNSGEVQCFRSIMEHSFLGDILLSRQTPAKDALCNNWRCPVIKTRKSFPFCCWVLSLPRYSLTLRQNIQSYSQKDLMKSMQWPEILLPGEKREREEKYIKWLIKKEACALPSRGYSLLSHPMWGSFP